MKPKRKIQLAALICSILAGMLAGISFIGTELRTPGLLTIFFTGMGAGAALVAFIKDGRIN